MSGSGQPVVVGTWSFSAEPVKVAFRMLSQRHKCLDSVEKGLNFAETNDYYGPHQVGRAGPRNNKGDLEMDAALFCGSGMTFGAVTALKGIAEASSVARCVMERSPHSMLTGQGALEFALHCGFTLDSSLVQCDTSTDMEGAVINQKQQHDTLGLLALDCFGDIAAGVTTTGMKGKARGRIGDSPLPGCGLYADKEVGAVCCSGEGDQIMKFCPSFMVTEYMRQGLSPEAACQAAVRRIIQRIAPSQPFELAVIAVNIKGEVGASTTVKEWTDVQTGQLYPGFPYAVCSLHNDKLALEIRTAAPEYF